MRGACGMGNTQQKQCVGALSSGCRHPEKWYVMMPGLAGQVNVCGVLEGWECQHVVIFARMVRAREAGSAGAVGYCARNYILTAIRMPSHSPDIIAALFTKGAVLIEHGNGRAQIILNEELNSNVAGTDGFLADTNPFAIDAQIVMPLTAIVGVVVGAGATDRIVEIKNGGGAVL